LAYVDAQGANGVQTSISKSCLLGNMDMCTWKPLSLNVTYLPSKVSLALIMPTSSSHLMQSCTDHSTTGLSLIYNFHTVTNSELQTCN